MISRGRYGISRTGAIIESFYKRLTELLDFDSYDEVKIYHKRWVDDYLGNGNNFRDDKWIMSIAVGNRSFVEWVKSLMTLDNDINNDTITIWLKLMKSY